MSTQWKWVISIVSIVVVFALLACGIFFAWRYFFPGKPSVVINAPPSNYQAVEGDEVAVEARATGRSIVKLELWVDDGLMDTASSPSPQDAFSAALTWQASGVGSHIVEVRAYDARGQASEPSAIVLIVTAGVAEVTPTVTLGPPFETPSPTTPPTETPTSPPEATATPTSPPPTATPTSPPPTATPTLAPAVINYFTIDDDTITDGGSTTLRWEFSNATESHLYRDGVEIESGLSSPGTKEVNPHVTRTFKLVVSNAAGSAEASVTLTVTPAGPPDIEFFTANPDTIPTGASSTLSWGLVSNADSVEIDQGIGGVATPGSTVVSPATTTTYTMTAVGAGGTTTAQVMVTVIPPTPIQDQFQTATDYGYWFEATVIRWQEFKPTLSHVTAVQIYVQRAGNPGNVITEIRTVGGTVLAQKIANVPSTGWFTFDFPAAVDVSPGTKYRIYVYADQDSPGPSHRYFWRGGTSSTYDSQCHTDVSGALPDYDYAFKTFGY